LLVVVILLLPKIEYNIFLVEEFSWGHWKLKWDKM